MKSTSTPTTAQLPATRLADCLTAVLLAVSPFHAFLTVWAAQGVGHYTLLRAWSSALLGVLLVLAVWWLSRVRAVREWVKQETLVKLIFTYAALVVAAGALGYGLGGISGDAAALGIVQDLRFLAFFLIVWTLAKHSGWLRRHWRLLLLGPALIVVAFAVLQLLVLPHDFLKHFGYSAATIEPYETINNDADFPRFASTLRGANPLGAYLVVIISILITFRTWRKGDRLNWGLFAGGALVALLASFSRSAWLGVAVAIAVIALLWAKSAGKLKQAALISLGMVVLTGVTFTALAQTEVLQNALFHTSDNSTVAASSNDQRSSALLAGVREVASDPLGDGTGSAGPASVHNDHAPTKLAENYFLQVGQETGWLGLGLFVAIIALLGWTLWRKRADPLALACLASLLGLIVVNLLSHAWADDTLAFTWWGLAGIALGGTNMKLDKTI